MEQQVPNLVLHLTDPGVLGLIKGLKLLEHDPSYRVHSVDELLVQELHVLLQLEVVVVEVGASVSTDGGREAGERLLLLRDPGCQGPDHCGQPHAGSGGHG